MLVCSLYEGRQLIAVDEAALRIIRLIDGLVATGEDPVGLVDDDYDFMLVVAGQQIADLVH
jgi:hypothetical protein